MPGLSLSNLPAPGRGRSRSDRINELVRTPDVRTEQLGYDAGGRKGLRMSRDAQRGVTLVELLVVLVVIAALLGLLLPAIQSGREASRRMGCQANLHELGTAVSLFVNATRRVPNPPTDGAMGGWAIDILPFIEETALAGLSGAPPLNSPTALSLAAHRPPVMRCPGGYDGDSDIPGIPVSHFSASINVQDRKRIGWRIEDVPTDSRVPWVLSPTGGFPQGASPSSMPHAGGYNEAGGGDAEVSVYFVSRLK
jgi:prepilin-type N-terminal cleavage/methylation domain-containing protein